MQHSHGLFAIAKFLVTFVTVRGDMSAELSWGQCATPGDWVMAKPCVALTAPGQDNSWIGLSGANNLGEQSL